MLIILPTYIRDYDRALKLASWMRDLGGTANHTCLLTTARSIENADEVMAVLQTAFKSVERLIPHEDATANWGEERASSAGPNILFQNSARWIAHKFKVPWLWMECDAVPLVSDWLDRIEAAYHAQKKPFMGAYVDFKPAPPHMSGIAVYPANVALHAPSAMRCREGAWDLNGAKEILPKATFTKLIQHVWKIGTELPQFPRDIGIISPEAVIFHRDKFLGIPDALRKAGDAKCIVNTDLNGTFAQAAKASLIPTIPSNAPATSEPEAGVDKVARERARDYAFEMIAKTNENMQANRRGSHCVLPVQLEIRNMVEALECVIKGNPGHIASLHKELRKAHLLRPAKKRKK